MPYRKIAVKKPLGTLSLVLLTALAAVACGSDPSTMGRDDHMEESRDTMHGDDKMHGGDEEPSAIVEGSREIQIVGNNFRYEPDGIDIGTGEDVTLVLEARDIEHDIRVAEYGHVVHASGGETERGGLRIDEPGSYEFWCTIPGHRSSGMEGTITVT